MKGRCPECKSTNVFVSLYKGKWSKVNGHRKKSSNYSEILCEACGCSWRTKANFVEDLPKVIGFIDNGRAS
jgi:transcription elongation factor Elf1